MGTVFSSRLGGSVSGEGILVDMLAFHQPVEEPVQTPVLGVDVTLGKLLGFGVGPLTEPPLPVLKVREILLQVLRSDLLYVRPLVFLGVQGNHRHRRFQAGEIPFGVPVGCLQAAEKPLSVSAKTVVKNLLDDHSSGGT